jgi:hypothetical protein
VKEPAGAPHPIERQYKSMPMLLSLTIGAANRGTELFL